MSAGAASGGGQAGDWKSEETSGQDHHKGGGQVGDTSLDYHKGGGQVGETSLDSQGRGSGG